jgi:hypothetical protein
MGARDGNLHARSAPSAAARLWRAGVVVFGLIGAPMIHIVACIDESSGVLWHQSAPWLEGFPATLHSLLTTLGIESRCLLRA